MFEERDRRDDEDEPGVRRVTFRSFESNFQSWASLFGDAAAFASTIDERDLISISHSHQNTRGVVTVWYWEES